MSPMTSPPEWVRRAGRLVHHLFISWGVQGCKHSTCWEVDEFGLNLSGACGMASYVLWQALLRIGEPAEFCYSEWAAHAWVEWRGWVLDTTYTQFNARSRKLRWVKIGSRTWKQSKYSEGTLRGVPALCEMGLMSEYIVQRHQKRLATIIRDVVSATEGERERERVLEREAA